MLDIKFIRENIDVIKAGAQKKHVDFDVDELIKIDDERREILNKVELMRARQNEVSQQVPNADDEEKKSLIDEMTRLKVELQQDEERLRQTMAVWQKLMLQLPNIPDVSVPEGESDADNQEVRVWGEIPKFDFEAKDHIQLMKDLDLADFEKGTKIAGFRGYILKNEGALLQFAIQQYVLQKMVAKGFTPMILPSMVNKETLIGTGYLPQGEDDLYKTQDDNYLSGTAEVPAMSYHAGEVLDKSELPKKYLAYSPCFRREIGSHSKDTKGLIRVHEFHKLEQIILCEASHEKSVALHEELTKNSEEIMQDLKIPYHVVVNCGGDLGLGQVKKYDIEGWVPSQNTYRETHSSSYFHDFQTRRLNIKYKDGDKKLYTHSLNNTAIAFPRILVLVIENYQQPDGTIKIPEVLIPFIGKDLITKEK